MVEKQERFVDLFPVLEIGRDVVHPWQAVGMAEKQERFEGPSQAIAVTFYSAGLPYPKKG